MKTFKFLLLSLVLIGTSSFFTSCDNNKTASEKVEEAGESMADAFRSEREELQADLRELRKEIDNKLAELRADMEEASEEAKEGINRQINKLEAWGKDIDRDMERVSQSAENGWEDLKGNVRNSLNEIGNAWDEAFDS